MSDFYSVLKQSIIDRGLSSPESREEAYAQARRAMINRLWSYDPPLAEDEIDHRIGQFDTAVARIEDDVVAVFAAMDSASHTAADEDGPYRDEPGYAPSLGGTGAVYDYDRDSNLDDDGLPEPGPIPNALRALEERSRAVERALQAADEEHTDPPMREAAAYDADLAGWPGSGTAGEGDIGEDAPVATPPRAPASAPRQAKPKATPRPRSAAAPRPSPFAGVAAAASRIIPAGRPSHLRLLIGMVAILAVVFVAGLVWLLLPSLSTPAGNTVALQTDVPGGVSDPDTAVRLPKEAITVTNSFSLFDGKDPTVFDGDPGNPVRFDGEFARIATSASSSGAKVIIGAGLSSRLAGRTIRVTLDARSARENGATSMRFAYQSGVAISHWQTANLAADFTELGLVWRVPTLRTSPSGDFIIIEPGIPGSGTGVEIRSVKIDLVDQ